MQILFKLLNITLQNRFATGDIIFFGKVIALIEHANVALVWSTQLVYIILAICLEQKTILL